MREAAVMLIIKDGMVLAISRRYDRTKFGLLGGKKDPEDFSTKETAIREAFEEANVLVKDCEFIYKRVEPKESPSGEDFNCSCYYALDWSGEPSSTEEGDVKWLTKEELCSNGSPFSSYNKNTFLEFQKKYPEVHLK